MSQSEQPIPQNSGKKRDLLSLLDFLHHAATVVRPGRAFLRSLIDAAAAVQGLDHWVHLNSSARADLAWWHTFLGVWNGTSIMPPTGTPLLLISDASGVWGCGAFHGNCWFQLQWPESWAAVSIALKELVPIVVAATPWGPQWAGKHVQCLCDNAAVRQGSKQGRGKGPYSVALAQNTGFSSSHLRHADHGASHSGSTECVSGCFISQPSPTLFLSEPAGISGSSSYSSRATRAGVQPQPVLDITQLDAVVEGFLGDCIAPATRAVYKSAQCRYGAFCVKYGVATPYPLQEDTLCRYVAFLAREGLRHRSIKSYLSGIRCLQIQHGFGNPFADPLSRLEYVLTGIKRVEARGSSTSRTRLPITMEILERLRGVWLAQPTGTDGVMLWAAACTGFFGFLRAGEFTVPSADAYDPASHLSLNDVALDSHTNPSMVRLVIKQSKTDPFHQGMEIFVGQSSTAVCPVQALLQYIGIRPATPGPLFVLSTGLPLTRAYLVSNLQAALRQAGLDDTVYNGHSFRIGAATTAAQRGLEDSLIQTLGRWRSDA